MKIERLVSVPPGPGRITDEVEGLIDLLDGELMKRGTLSAETIDWPKIRKISEQVLQDCLHLQALRALIFALCQTQVENDLSGALQIMQDAFAPAAWQSLHPQGPRHERKRRQWGQDMLGALYQGLKQLDLAMRGLPPDMLAKARKLLPAAAAIHLDSAAFAPALHELRERGKHTGPQAAAEPLSPLSGKQDLDAKGRAELRRDMRALAERISRYEPQAEVAFLMRRYAAWLEFRALPPVDEGHKIEQQPMPANIADEFRRLADRPNDGALFRLEDRLFNSPDWFEGHRLAARMAQAMGYDQVADIIQKQVAKRLSDLPGLVKLRYANGMPYIDEDLVKWARFAEEKPHIQVEIVPAPEQDAPPAGLQDRIAELEGKMQTMGSRRARTVAKLALARELGAFGLAQHARFLLQEINETLSDPVLAHWDKELADEVRAALGTMGRA